MAVNSQPSLVSGTIPLITLRTILGLLGLVLLVSGGADAASAVGADPRFVEVNDGPWPFFQLTTATALAVKAMVSPAFIAGLILLFGKLYLDGAATRWYALHLQGSTDGFWSTFFREGWGWWWAMFRVTLYSAVLLVVAAIVAFATGQLLFDTTTLEDQMINAPQFLTRVSILLFWVIGAIALWSRAYMAVKGHKRSYVGFFKGGVGHLFTTPAKGLLLYVLLNALPFVGGAVLLIWMRITEPVAMGEMTFLAVGSLIVFLQALVWRQTLTIAVSTIHSRS